MIWKTRITEMIQSRYPIIMGAFASIGNAEFAAAFSNAGGFGIITASIYTSLKKFQGHLSDGAATLADAFDAFDHLTRREGKVFIYAAMSHYVDTTDQKAAERFSRVQGLYGQMLAATGAAGVALTGRCGRF